MALKAAGKGARLVRAETRALKDPIASVLSAELGIKGFVFMALISEETRPQTAAWSSISLRQP